MAESFVSYFETVEARTLMSSVPPILSQFPPVFVEQTPPQTHKVTAPIEPVSTFPPSATEPALPPSQPVQAVVADAPKGLKARPCFKAASICLSWQCVDSSAKTTVIEASTDGGKTFTTIAMLDADQTKFGATHLNRHKSYTFRVYTLDANSNASPTGDLPVSWVCKKK